MHPSEARFLLAAWRPDTPVNAQEDPRLAEALALAERDAELGAWLRQQREGYHTVRAALRQVPVPLDLADRILAARKTVRPEFRPRPDRARVFALAAGLLALGLAAIWLAFLRPAPTPTGDLATFRSRMVRAVLREYRMDIVTNDLAAVRGFLGAHEAPADFVLPPRLAALPITGGGLLSWQGRQVSMVCLDGGQRGTFFLFVTPSDTLRPEPAEVPTLARISRLGTIAWSGAGRTFVLAAELDPLLLQAFL